MNERDSARVFFWGGIEQSVKDSLFFSRHPPPPPNGRGLEQVREESALKKKKTCRPFSSFDRGTSGSEGCADGIKAA
jgi:hypothetical protein